MDTSALPIKACGSERPEILYCFAKHVYSLRFLRDLCGNCLRKLKFRASVVAGSTLGLQWKISTL